MQPVMDAQASLKTHRHLTWNQSDLRRSVDKFEVWFIAWQVGRA